MLCLNLRLQPPSFFLHGTHPLNSTGMSTNSIVAFAAAVYCAALGGLSVLRRHSVASLCFFFGMVAFGAEAVFQGLSLQASSGEQIVLWQNLAFLARSFGPGVWLVFSLTYSRGNYREFLH